MDRKAAVSIVVRGETLLCVWNRRSNGWSLPGGMVEDGETPEDAQERELLEETGLHTRDRQLLYEGPHGVGYKPGRASVVVVYLVTPLPGEPVAREPGCPVAWLTPARFLEQSPFGPFYCHLFARYGALVFGR